MKRVMLVMFLSSLTLFEVEAGRKDKDTFNEGGMRHRNTHKKRSSSSEPPSPSSKKHGYSALIEETDQGEKSARSYDENSNSVPTSNKQAHQDEKPDWYQEGEMRFGEWLQRRGNEKIQTDLAAIVELLSSFETENGFHFAAEGYGIEGKPFLKYMQNFCCQMKGPGWMFEWEKQKK